MRTEDTDLLYYKQYGDLASLGLAFGTRLFYYSDIKQRFKAKRKNRLILYKLPKLLTAT